MKNIIKFNKFNKSYLWDTISHNLIDESCKNKEKYLSNDILIETFKEYQNKTIVNELNVYIGVTLECNLQCTYCFEKTIEKVSTLTSHKIDLIFETIELYKNHYGYSSVNIIFYGGEPLLKQNKTIVNQIFNYIFEKKYNSKIITNGVELHEFSFILNKYSRIIDEVLITLDGDQKTHDKFRKTQSEGSFNKIINNIKNQIKNIKNININIRINISKDNINSIEPLLIYLKAENIYNYINKIYIHKVENKTGDLSIKNIENNLNILMKYIELKKSYHKLDMQILNLSTILKIFENHNKIVLPNFKSCNIENQLVFNPNGDFYNCSEAMGVKELKIGTFFPKIDMDFDHINDIKKSYDSKFSNCLDCSVKYVCGGNCYLEYFSNNFICKQTLKLLSSILKEEIIIEKK